MRQTNGCSYLLLVTLGGAAALGAHSALAATDGSRLLASQCAQCHGTNGHGGFDSLAGKSAAELYEELLEMKNGRVIEGIMDLQARAYTDQQLWSIAQYFSLLPSRGGGDGGGDGGDSDSD